MNSQGNNSEASLTAGGSVVLYSAGGAEPSRHEREVHTQLARKLAALKGYCFAGEYDGRRQYRGALYFVPFRTLTDDQSTRQLGIRSEKDLFGGVVPFAMIGTKVISHSLVKIAAFAPPGWSQAFSDEVKPVTLFGFSAFTRADAVHAGKIVLARGQARVKPACGVGGRGQTVVANAHELTAAIDKIDDEEFFHRGVVVEENLRRVTTFSVGQVRVAGLVASYYGTQRLTKDSDGQEVYGGSELVVVRGGYNDLLRLDLTSESRRAVTQARAYDEAASKHFTGLIASRRNYDVAQGLDSGNQSRSGVLEQSWRIGGASSAEIIALQAFCADPELRVVQACCVERYGLHDPPPSAVLQFRGNDDRVGEITRYTVIEPYAGGQSRHRDSGP